MRTVTGFLLLLVVLPAASSAETLGEASVREMRRRALRDATAPACSEADAVAARAADLGAAFRDNTVPIALCHPARDQRPEPGGKVFLSVDVDERGAVSRAVVTRVIGDPTLAEVARERELGTTYFPVHHGGVPVSTSFQYCRVFRERQQ
jgi:outer membrane biosynthesis protein TonB